MPAPKEETGVSEEEPAAPEDLEDVSEIEWKCCKTKERMERVRTVSTVVSGTRSQSRLL